MASAKIDVVASAVCCDRQTLNLSILNLIGCLLALKALRDLRRYFCCRGDFTWHKTTSVIESIFAGASGPRGARVSILRTSKTSSLFAIFSHRQGRNRRTDPPSSNCYEDNLGGFHTPLLQRTNAIGSCIGLFRVFIHIRNVVCLCSTLLPRAGITKEIFIRNIVFSDKQCCIDGVLSCSFYKHGARFGSVVCRIPAICIDNCRDLLLS